MIVIYYAWWQLVTITYHFFAPIPVQVLLILGQVEIIEHSLLFLCQSLLGQTIHLRHKLNVIYTHIYIYIYSLRSSYVNVIIQRQPLFAYLSHPIHWSISSDKYLLRPLRNRSRFYLFRKLLHMLMQTKPYHQMRVEVHMPEADQTTLAKTSVQTNLKIFYIFYIKVKVRDEQNFLRTW